MPDFLVTGPDGTKYQVTGPEGATEADAVAQVMAQIGDNKPHAEEGSSLGGSVKAFGSGIGRGAINLAGLPGDIAELGTKGINYLAGTNLENKIPLPTSAGIQKAVEGVTGPFYQPKGTAEEYLQTLGEFTPGLLMPGSAAAGIGRKVATQVVAPALASETAGQLTKGTETEPYARATGALAGGIAGLKFAQPAVKQLSLEEIGRAGSAGYDALKGAQFNSSYVQRVSDQAQAALRRDKFNDKTAGKTFAVLDDLKTPAGPTAQSLPGPFNPPIPAAQALAANAGHGFEDFQAARTQLSKIAGNFNDPIEQAAASKAINFLDQQLSSVPQSALKNMSVKDFTDTLEKARADYAVAKTGQRIQDLASNVELQATSANSGMNLQNALKQKMRLILTNPKKSRGLTDAEQAAIENLVRGNIASNTARYLGNYLGGGGGLGAVVTGLGGMYASGGNPIGLAAPAAGFALKYGLNKLAQRQANKIIEQIRSRSPSNLAHLQTQPMTLLQSISKPQLAARLALLAQLSAAPRQSGILPINQLAYQ